MTEQRPVLKLVSPICPSVNHYLGYRAVMRGGRPLAMSYKTEEARRYQDRFQKIVQQEARRQGWVMSDNRFQHYYMDCVFYFDRIDCDANNYFKCMADAITMSKVVWLDDTQCFERVQGIFNDVQNPRVEITITPVDYIGVFKTSEKMDAFFAENCESCTRGKRKCQLFTKAKQGRIQTEIDFEHNYCHARKVKKDKKENRNYGTEEAE